MMIPEGVIAMRNRETGKIDTIRQHDLTMKDWGFSFFTDTELDAYRAAYLYRASKHGVKVEWAEGAKRWMVTVFNEFAAKAGIAT
jgi:hypothetical protein